MVEEVVFDSSVIVSAFVKGERFRQKATAALKKVFAGEHLAILSTIVPVEVCGSISRRVGVKEAQRVGSQLVKWQNMGLITYLELDLKRREQAKELAIKFQLRGMDAIVVQAAVERKCSFITFDEEVAERVKGTVEVLTYQDLPAN